MAFKKEIMPKDLESTKLHSGGQVAWDASEEILNWLENNLRVDMNTLETGAGKTTLVFMGKSTNHHVITPSSDEIDKIKAAAQRFAIDSSRTIFHQGYSQDILPNLKEVKDLDVVLIDGGHGFPIPAVDWLYCAPKLRIGGTLIIDDIDLWTGKMLVDVLKGEPEWRFESIKRGRTAIFTKIATFEAREWCDQSVVVKKSAFGQTKRKVQNALALLLKFDFASIKKKLKQEKSLNEAAKQPSKPKPTVKQT